MAKLSREEIAKAAANAGFSGDDINIAVAVALAESGGNPRAHNSTPPDNSYGLWQINMLGAMGPDRRKRYGLRSNEDLFDPAVNARVAYGIFKGSGWKAWTTYTRGTYKKHLNANDSAGAGGGSGTEAAPATGGLDPVLGVGDAINAFGSTMFKGLANIAGIAIAIALIVIGAVFLLRNVVPVGKAVKIAKKVTK